MSYANDESKAGICGSRETSACCNKNSSRPERLDHKQQGDSLSWISASLSVNYWNWLM